MSTPIDFDAFHQRDLPAMLAAGNGELAHAALRKGSLAFRVGGTAYTY